MGAAANASAFTTDDLPLCLDSVREKEAPLSVVLSGFATTLFCLVGVLGNAFSLWHIRQTHFNHRSLSRVLSSLAIWDTLLLLSTFAYYGLSQLWGATQPSANEADRFNFLSAAFHPVAGICYVASAWHVVWITVLQYLAVAQPFRYTQQETTWAQFSAPVIISLGALLLKLPTFLEMKVKSCWSADDESLATEIVPTRLRMDERYAWAYRVPSQLLLVTVGPFVVVFVLTVAIARRLHSADVARARLVSVPYRVTERFSLAASIPRPSQNRSPKILLTLLSKYLLSHTLPAVLDVWEASVGLRNVGRGFFQLALLSNLAVVLNSATNFLVYLRGCPLRAVFGSRCVSLAANAQTIGGSLDARSIDCLSAVWTRMECRGDAGATIVAALLRRCPNLLPTICPHATTGTGSGKRTLTPLSRRLRLGHTLSTSSLMGERDAWIRSEGFKREASRVTSFLAEVIEMLQDETDGGDGERRVETMARAVGIAHYEAGVNFTDETWRELKTVVLKMARQQRDGRDGSETVQIWARFVDALVLEMKCGFIAAAEVANDIVS